MTQLLGTNLVHQSMIQNIKYEKKDKNVSIRLSQPDYESLINIAKKYDVSLSTFLRCWICSVIDFEEELTEIEKNENII